MLRTLGSRRLWAAVLALAIAWSAFAPPHAASGDPGAAAAAGAPCAEGGERGPHDDGSCCAHAPGLTTGRQAPVRLPAVGFAPTEAQRPRSPFQEPPLRVPIA